VQVAQVRHSLWLPIEPAGPSGPPQGRIDARYIEKPYYIAARDAVGQEAFAVIRDALERKQLLGIGPVILQSRERPIALEPMGKVSRFVGLALSPGVSTAPPSAMVAGNAHLVRQLSVLCPGEQEITDG
jgi:hypothetical protein